MESREKKGKEPEPKGKGERKDNRTLPGGRKPNPTLSGGEGIEPYELYSIILAELRELAAKQQCTWFCSFDATAFSRYDQVIHPPKAPAPHTQSSSSTDPPWKKRKRTWRRKRRWQGKGTWFAIRSSERRTRRRT